MTPAINAAKAAGIEFTIHEYQHDPSASSYGLEAAEKLNLSVHQVFKTLVVETGTNDLAVCILPVDTQLNLKRAAKSLGVKKVAMAEAKKVERTTGYVLGGVSPIGQKRKLTTLVDSSAEQLSTVFVSAGKRGLEIELKPLDLQRLTEASFVLLSADEM